jgi:hypothetical protein
LGWETKEKQVTNPGLYLKGFFVPISIFFGLLPAFAEAGDDYRPVYNPELHISRANGHIRIDGELNDPGWRHVARADNFAEHRPGDQTKPPVETEALITYDDKNLYVAFICYDDPSTVRASHSDRDVMGMDDNICLLLDPFCEATWAYELNVNPYGVQGDYMWSKNGDEDEAMDLIWDAMARITDSGYQVEMAVPFSSLRFPNAPKQTWKVDFWRNHPRDSRRQYSWAAYDRNNPCWPCQWGTVTGIENVNPGKGIEFLPTLIGFRSGALADVDNPNSDWLDEDVDGEAALNLKYSLSSSTTAEVTYNPDFSQVESDETQIDVNTTFALFYPERRPFFQEGSDLFNSYLEAVYTRSINDPQFAAKIVSRSGKTSLAYLIAHDEHSPVLIPLREQSGLGLAGRSTSNILRMRTTFGEDSHFGILLTDRRFDVRGSNTVFGYDASLRFGKCYTLMGQILGSYSVELDDPSLIDTTTADGLGQVYFNGRTHTVALDGESFSGHNVYLGLEREGRHWAFNIDYNEESPKLRADNGFIFMNGTRSINMIGRHYFYFDTKLLDAVTPSVMIGRVWRHEDGHFKEEWLTGEITVQLKAQTLVVIEGLLSRESFKDILFRRIRQALIVMDSRFSDPLSLGFVVGYGHLIARNADPPAIGKQADIEFWATIKPTDRLKIWPQLTYSKSIDRDTDKPIYEGSVFRTRLAYQFTRRLHLRFVVQYNDFYKLWEFDPLLTYRLGPQTVFYAGSTHDFYDYERLGMKQAAQQFFFKMQYLMQI